MSTASVVVSVELCDAWRTKSKTGTFTRPAEMKNDSVPDSLAYRASKMPPLSPEVPAPDKRPTVEAFSPAVLTKAIDCGPNQAGAPPVTAEPPNEAVGTAIERAICV